MIRHRMFSEPVELVFAGFRGRTDEMQYNGWQFEAEQDIRRRTLRIAGTHRMADIRLITEVSEWDYGRFFPGRAPPLPVMQIIAMGRNVQLQLHGHVAFNFKPIDAMPQWREYSNHRLEDLVHFTPVEMKQLILPEDDINTLLEKALKLQEPARLERAQKRVHGQLISIS